MQLGVAAVTVSGSSNCTVAEGLGCSGNIVHLQPPAAFPGRQLRGAWAPRGSREWAHEVVDVPARLQQEPWASPVAAEWCAEPARPRLFVVLTASVKAFINLARRGLRDQQRNTTERQEMYQQVVRRWAVASNARVIFAENSGSDLSPFEAMVPPWRRAGFEFLRVPYEAEKLPPRGRPDVGRIEARSIVHALNASTLLATRCPQDIIFGVTGRYFVHDFEHLVHAQCLKDRGRSPSQGSLPLVLPQNPVWRNSATERTKHERETSVLGFAASHAFEVFGWSVAPAPTDFEAYAHLAIGSEVHLGKLIKRMSEKPELHERVCDLPPLPVMPVKEGSTGKWRESV